jgi:hypothetical protein
MIESYTCVRKSSGYLSIAHWRLPCEFESSPDARRARSRWGRAGCFSFSHAARQYRKIRSFPPEQTVQSRCLLRAPEQAGSDRAQPMSTLNDRLIAWLKLVGLTALLVIAFWARVPLG